MPSGGGPRFRWRTSAAVAALCLWCIWSTAADEQTHLYQPGDTVKVYANKMGPFNNPLETYAYFELPGCRPKSEEHKFPSLGQALAGDEHFEMNVNVVFGTSTTEPQEICRYTPSASDVEQWVSMVRQQYWYQLLADDLPMWAVFGNHSRSSTTTTKDDANANDKVVMDEVIYTHQRFSFGKNGQHVVSVNLTVDQPVRPKAGEPISFTYSVSWSDCTVEFDQRFDRYLDNSFFEHRIHWFSIFNSFMIVLFLVGLVGAILSRTLRAEYAKLTEERAMRDQGKEDWVEDSGWKQLHADVFRVPKEPALLCALVGTGAQLITLTFVVTLIAMASSIHTAPSGSFLTYSVLSFALTSFIAGYVSSTLYTNFSHLGPNLSQRWMHCMYLTATLFPGTVLAAGFLLNFVAIAYDSAQAIPFGGMIVMLLLWGLISCPLVVIGTVVGRHGGSRRDMRDPPRINQIPRIVPPRPWYRNKWFFVVGGGILPFGSIFIELYLVFTSFWGYKLYYVFGFLALVSLILVVVTACVSIVCTYFLVSAEDHRWQWTSFHLGASTAGYVMLYAIYFYFFKTKMTGFFMFCFYFVYMTLLSLGLAIMCGTVGYLAAAAFIRRIYRNVKTD